MRNKLSQLVIGTLCFSIIVSQVFGQTINLDNKQVVYPLPYPGILTDHPLYSLKEFRDKIIIFTTRDNIKKAQLYLNLSDKHIATAMALAEKGREQLATQELIQAEDYFLKIVPLLLDAKEQGTGASNDFISKLSQSNEKHKEVISEVMQQTNEAKIETFKDILKKNEQAKKDLRKL